LCGDRASASDAVFEHECVVPTLIDIDGVREALVQRTYVCEPAARRDDREWSVGLASEEKQASVPSGRLRLLLRVGVDVVKGGLAGADVIDHSIERRDDESRIDVCVVRKQRPDVSEQHVGVVASIVPGQDQAAEPGECWMFEDVVDAVVDT